MSGVEVAGLVLGAIPLLIHALERYAEGVASFKRYLKYKREIASLIRRLGLELEVLRNTLEELLNGIVPAEQMEGMLDDPGGSSWKNPEFNQKLAKRLRGAYTKYLGTMKDMNEAVEEFRNRLKLDEKLDTEAQSNSPRYFLQMYKRFKFSLCRKDYEDLLDRIRDGNNYLKRLTSQNLRLEPSRTSQIILKTPCIEAVRGYTQSLMSTLRSSFNCPCKATHCVNLHLEQRSDEQLMTKYEHDPSILKLSFRVTFNMLGTKDVSSLRSATVYAAYQPSNSSANGKTNEEPCEPEVAVQKAARFADTGNPEANTFLGGRPISFSPPSMLLSQGDRWDPVLDLCHVLAAPWSSNEPEGGRYLLKKPGSQQKFFIYPSWRGRTISYNQPFSLYDAITRNGIDNVPPLRVSDKKNLAAIIASSLLQFCGSSEFNVRWKLKNVAFLWTAGMNGSPYRFPYVGIPLTNKEGSLSIEEKATEKVTEACPNIRNESVFALGILLIELCLGRPIEDLRIPSDLNPDGTEHITTDFKTATRLLDDVYQEAGGRYGDAVRRCIYCEFDQRKTSLEDPAFRKAVYKGVVYWLEEDLREFHNLT